MGYRNRFVERTWCTVVIDTSLEILWNSSNLVSCPGTPSISSSQQSLRPVGTMRDTNRFESLRELVCRFPMYPITLGVANYSEIAALPSISLYLMKDIHWNISTSRESDNASCDYSVTRIGQLSKETRGTLLISLLMDLSESYHLLLQECTIEIKQVMIGDDLNHFQGKSTDIEKSKYNSCQGNNKLLIDGPWTKWRTKLTSIMDIKIVRPLEARISDDSVWESLDTNLMWTCWQ